MKEGEKLKSWGAEIVASTTMTIATTAVSPPPLPLPSPPTTTTPTTTMTTGMRRNVAVRWLMHGSVIVSERAVKAYVSIARLSSLYACEQQRSHGASTASHTADYRSSSLLNTDVPPPSPSPVLPRTSTAIINSNNNNIICPSADMID